MRQQLTADPLEADTELSHARAEGGSSTASVGVGARENYGLAEPVDAGVAGATLRFHSRKNWLVSVFDAKGQIR